MTTRVGTACSIETAPAVRAADFSPLEFCQRFIGVFGDGCEMIRGAWEISENGQDWRQDFTLTYRKVSR